MKRHILLSVLYGVLALATLWGGSYVVWVLLRDSWALFPAVSTMAALILLFVYLSATKANNL